MDLLTNYARDFTIDDFNCLDLYKNVNPKHIKFNKVQILNLLEFKKELDSHFNPAICSFNDLNIGLAPRDLDLLQEFSIKTKKMTMNIHQTIDNIEKSKAVENNFQ